MNATGVVVEYNPFHNGHLYHLQESKRKSNADIVIAVMSGHFLQRGEPALVSKWARAKMALLAGVDLVIELPYSFATQHAEVFAKGSISLLDNMQCSSFCFGSEDGDIQKFLYTLELLHNKSSNYNQYVQQYVKEGMSYPSALSQAFKQFESNHTVDLSKPNNILGYHYLEAIKNLSSKMEGYTVTRKSAQYHDIDFSSDTIASATSIRRKLLATTELDITEVSSLIPVTTLDVLYDYLKHFEQLHSWEHYWPLLKYKLLTSSSVELSNLYEVEEGIENRLKREAVHSNSFEEFMQKVKTKRYTWTRIQRMLLHILTNTSKKEMFSQSEYPSYIRLLGMTAKGRKYLNIKRKDISLPIITNYSSAKHINFELDNRAAEVYSLGLHNYERQMELLLQERQQPPIMV